MVSGHLDLAARCLVHANKADDAGLYTTANVLWLASESLKGQRDLLASLSAIVDTIEEAFPALAHMEQLRNARAAIAKATGA